MPTTTISIHVFHRYAINVGTVHKFNDAAVVSLLTSHLSICSSSLSWLLVTYLTRKNLNMADLLQGITTGLVGRFSSLGVGIHFHKVLRFSFPVSVVDPRAPALSLAFAAENIKNLPLALHTREKIWARLVGKSRVGVTQKQIYSLRLRPTVQPVTLLYTIFDGKDETFVYLLLTKHINGIPFTYIPRFELCIFFNCCKCPVFEYE